MLSSAGYVSAFIEVLLVAFIVVLLVLVMCLVCWGEGVCWCASVGAKSKIATIQIQKLWLQ